APDRCRGTGNRVPGSAQRGLLRREPAPAAQLPHRTRGPGTRGAEQVRSTRLVTLSGVAGVGKTRLALEVGAELSGEFPEGAWMVDLASVGDPASVPAAIASVLGITPASDTSLIDAVAEALAGRRLLLVVDNCEHVLEAAALA